MRTIDKPRACIIASDLACVIDSLRSLTDDDLQAVLRNLHKSERQRLAGQIERLRAH